MPPTANQPRRRIWTSNTVMLVCFFGFASAAQTDSPREVWMGLTAEQKQVSLTGFIHCVRTAPASERAFARRDDVAAIRAIDEHVKDEPTTAMGPAMLQALKSSPAARADPGAEQWSGPYGFSTGLWWRQLDEVQRRAYVQGVFWCADSGINRSVRSTKQTVQQAVTGLDAWYVTSDEDWKDARSNQRVDIPVIVAMRKTGAISLAPEKKP